MEWKILEYETTRGERPVTEFIKKQKQKTPQKEIKTARQRYLSLT